MAAVTCSFLRARQAVLWGFGVAMTRSLWAIVALGVGAAGLGLPGRVLASTADAVNVSYLQGLLPKLQDNVTTLGPQIMGEQVNMSSGSLEFVHTDITLPGNSALAVALIRKHTAGRHSFVRGQLGDWDLEVPRMGGSFAMPRGWVNSAGTAARCSDYSAPPAEVRNATLGGGGSMSTTPGGVPGGAPMSAAQPTSGSGATVRPGDSTSPQQASINLPRVEFLPSDFWHGNFIHVPGAGSHEVLRRGSGDTLAPSDGNSWPLVTKDRWQVRCLPSIQNGSGEGFLALAPNGVQYRFDWMATRTLWGVKREGAGLPRSDVFLMATRATDRFGNWVAYTYNPAQPMQLTRIEASDGRVITLQYGSNGRVSSASDGTRTYTYSYSAQGDLSQVTQPDGARWEFSLRSLVHPVPGELGEGANCESPGAFPGESRTGWLRHPSGATGHVGLAFTAQPRSFVNQWCIFAGQKRVGAVWPQVTFSQAITHKTLSGPGLGSGLTWSYSYSATQGSWDPCVANCSDRKTVTVTAPDGVATRHTFGIRFRVNEGQLLTLEEGITGGVAQRVVHTRYRASGPWPEPVGESINQNHDFMSVRLRPEDQRQTLQQGASFTWEVAAGNAGFDNQARPLRVTRSSSLGHSRVEDTVYADNLQRWVLGQVHTLTEATSGVQMERTEYHPTTALPTQRFAWGRLVESFDYNADGTLNNRFDPLGRATRHLNWHRGIPRQVTARDGSNEFAEVNNLGRITSHTNRAGTTTRFGYDAMGRLGSITYPAETWGSYHPTTVTFVQAASPEFGLETGHWRLTEQTGDAWNVRYFDALWRERLRRSFDAQRPGSTLRVVETRWDAEGKKIYESQPSRDGAGINQARPGMHWVHDGLGRTVQQRQNSELGDLITQTQYGNGFTKTVTNPRGASSSFNYQAWDSPSEDHLAGATLPAGVWLSIPRDRFGKALSVSRGGSSGFGTSSVTRSYVYDVHQRLCKTVEPESGATIVAYDGAGNIAWRASGQAATGTAPQQCDHGAVPASARISFAYDAEDRLQSTTFGDGSPSISRSWTADGLPATVASGQSTWAYTYNNRRLLTAEALNRAGTLLSFGRGWNTHGHQAVLVYPNGQALDHAPDALGQPTQVSGYASGISFHPNGALAAYTAANGSSFTQQLNARGVPSRITHAPGLVDEAYTWDAAGNLASITDALSPAHSRSLGYDALDRLVTANGAWGAGSFSYDAVDNLRTSQLGARQTTTVLDGRNLISQASISTMGSFAIGYDANGNVTQRGPQGFSFDIGNRKRWTQGVASYEYDGHGRRTWVQSLSGGAHRLHAYTLRGTDGQVGQLLWSQDFPGGSTMHVYIGSQLIAESHSQTGTRWVHNDLLGSAVARSGAGAALISRTHYEPYGGIHSGTHPGSGAGVGSGVGYTGHVMDATTGLTYMQQRYQDPLLGRFLSVDPVVTDVKTGGFFGRYLYANNNPYKYTDPDGRLFEPDGGSGSGLPAPVGVTAQLLFLNSGSSLVKVEYLASLAAAPLARIRSKPVSAGSFTPRNMSLAGKNHHETGIPFDSNGYPDFSSVAIKSVKITPTGNRNKDRRAANKAAGVTSQPADTVWHHHQDGVTMQLLPREIHARTGHSGGIAVYKVNGRIESTELAKSLDGK
jgi:RHS repeat-associated protein